VLGIAGVVLSALAFSEARKAKKAATLAGRTVKLQSIAIELGEILHKLDELERGVKFNEARDLLSEISKRVRRAVSPFTKDPDLSAPIEAVLTALTTAHESLKSVRPTDFTKEADTADSVYMGIEDNFLTITNCVADLLGLFENQTIDIGETNAAARESRAN